MWYFGLGLAAVLVVMAGIAKGIKNLLVFSPNRLPKFMKTDFWDYRTEFDEKLNDNLLLCVFRKFITYVGLGNGYHLMHGIHWSFLALGSMLFTISVFFAAETPYHLVNYLGIGMASIYILRRIGKFIITRK